MFVARRNSHRLSQTHTGCFWGSKNYLRMGTVSWQCHVVTQQRALAQAGCWQSQARLLKLGTGKERSCLKGFIVTGDIWELNTQQMSTFWFIPTWQRGLSPVCS